MNRKALSMVLACMFILFGTYSNNHLIDEKEKQLQQRKQARKTEQKFVKLSSRVTKATTESLQNAGYRVNNVSVLTIPLAPKPIVEIKVEGTTKYYQNVQRDIKALAVHTVSAETKVEFDVNVKRKTESEIRDEKWTSILIAVSEEIHKKYKEYRGFAYSFKPAPLQITIVTDLTEADEKKAKEIEKYTKGIIRSKVNELAVDTIPYSIIIKKRDDKKSD
ncbi:hypothetical protein [Peribacillus sp. SCS-155]|uniref:hypothetical protein n=1 Tax=Peribacillus sedimenti TaxID=3115297 RepID=UPI003905F7FF